MYQLQYDLSIQYARTEQSRDAAQSQAYALEITLRDQAQQFETAQRQPAQSYIAARET